MVDQNSQFYAILTNIGAAKQANADALGIPWKITHMAVGDGNPAGLENPPLPMPSASATALLNEWRRAPLNQLKVDELNSAVIVAEQVIPADVGGRWIRELALFDADGDMVAVANCAPTYKPLLNQGSGRTQVVRMNLIVSSSSNVELKIDPSVVLATREWVTSELAKQDFKHSVLVATTVAIVLSGLQTVDGVALTAGARVLVKDQAAAKDNGLYQVVAGGPWMRCADADMSAEVTPGLLVLVERGALNGDSAWQLVTDGPISLGVTALAFEMAFGRTGVAENTYRSVTVDKYGRVIAATNPTTVAGYGLTDVYTKTQLDQALALKAPLVSPVFTGLPTAPTAAGGTNNNQLANTAFVQAAIAALVASSPAALDTLNELATALGNDPNFASTMTNALALKAPLASPTFTGDPKAPTPIQFDISKSIATAEFVQRALGSLRGVVNINDTITLTAAHVGVQLVGSVELSGKIVTLPPVASVAPGAQIHFSAGANNVPITIKAHGAELIAPGPGSGYTVNSFEMAVLDSVVLVNLGNVWRMVGGSQICKHSIQFAASLTANGYQKLPSGLIIQWGVAGNTNGFGTWTFPIAFPNACLRVFASQDASASGPAMYAVGAHPVDQATAKVATALASGGDAIFVFAIGY